MFCAINKVGNRVYAKNASRDEDYFCPVCKAPVKLRKGDVRAPHFAHGRDRLCTDGWNYETTVWRQKRLEQFPEKNREVIVVNKDGEKHRADVLIADTVILFRSRLISEERFLEITNFFQSLGYRVIWIFDMSERFHKGSIKRLTSPKNLCSWSRHAHIFRLLNKCPSAKDRDFAIYFQLDKGDDTKVWRVVWTPWNEGPDFSRFMVSENPVVMEQLNSIDEFLLPPEERRSRQVLAKVDAMYAEARRKNVHTENIKRKYMNERAHKPYEYLCPITNDWSREYICKKCRHCALIVEKKRGMTRPPCEFYCCYPNEYQGEGEQVEIYRI